MIENQGKDSLHIETEQKSAFNGYSIASALAANLKNDPERFSCMGNRRRYRVFSYPSSSPPDPDKYTLPTRLLWPESRLEKIVYRCKEEIKKLFSRN